MKDRAYTGRAVWLPRRECWALSVTDHEGPAPVRVQPRDVFDGNKLASQLQRFGLPVMRIQFADYTCELLRSPRPGPSRVETAKLMLLLGLLYPKYNRWRVSWHWNIDRNG